MSHWYDKDGNPRHFEGKDGKGTTLREARKLDLVPSVTTILGLLNKPALTAWIARECVGFAHDNPYHEWSMQNAPPEPKNTFGAYFSDYAKWVVQKQREQTQAKADAGSEIHDALENWPKVDGRFNPLGLSVEDIIMDETGLCINDFVPERSFSDPNFFAGMIDLSNDELVIDYKTKDGDVSKERSWPEQQMQLHAYDRGRGRRLANIFISRDPELWGTDKGVKFVEVPNDPIIYQKFLTLVKFWQLDKKYGPHYVEMSDGF